MVETMVPRWPLYHDSTLPAASVQRRLPSTILKKVLTKVLLSAVLPVSITAWLAAMLLLLSFLLVALMLFHPQVLHSLLEYIATLQASSLPL